MTPEEEWKLGEIVRRVDQIKEWAEKSEEWMIENTKWLEEIKVRNNPFAVPIKGWQEGDSEAFFKEVRGG